MKSFNPDRKYYFAYTIALDNEEKRRKHKVRSIESVANADVSRHIEEFVPKNYRNKINRFRRSGKDPVFGYPCLIIGWEY